MSPTLCWHCLHACARRTFIRVRNSASVSEESKYVQAVCQSTPWLFMRPVAFSRRVRDFSINRGCTLAQRDAAAYSCGHFGSTVVSQHAKRQDAGVICRTGEVPIAASGRDRCHPKRAAGTLRSEAGCRFRCFPLKPRCR